MWEWRADVNANARLPRHVVITERICLEVS